MISEEDRARLDALVAFLPAVEAAGFAASRIIVQPDPAPSVSAIPLAAYGRTADAFMEALHERDVLLPGLDWVRWKGTAAASALISEDEALAGATMVDLRRLLTVIARQERFADGSLLDHFESGLILRILRRASAILRAESRAP